MRHNPWRQLRDLEHVAVSWRSDLPAGMLGATDGRRIIFLHKDLLQVERRCTLTHELVHLQHGHTSCVDARTETAVRREAARRLIGIEDLISAARWTRSPGELAHELWVTEPVLRDRITALSPGELRRIERATASAWHQG